MVTTDFDDDAAHWTLMDLLKKKRGVEIIPRPQPLQEENTDDDHPSDDDDEMPEVYLGIFCIHKTFSKV